MTKNMAVVLWLMKKDQSYHSQWLWFSGDWFRRFEQKEMSKSDFGME